MYGIFSYDTATPCVGYKHGEYILNLERVSLLGFFDALDIDTTVFAQSVLNPFVALGKSAHQAVFQRIIELLSQEAVALTGVHEQVLIHKSRATMHLPVRIGDYTDFYAGIHHAENVGRIFRPNGDPLMSNYRHLPVAYHGRASSIVVSGTPIHRPVGQLPGPDERPTLGASLALDFELELGMIIGKSNPIGEPIPVDEAEDYIFGVVLFNDWSARDVQRWEYQPLGPFLGKNFASSLSAWVLPFSELEPFRIPGEQQKPAPLSYLQNTKPGHFNLDLEVWLAPPGEEAVCICHTNARYLYWNFAQMIAHHTIGGCNLNVGDVLATGTISGPEAGGFGSLLEASWNGERLLHVSDTAIRTFLENGDTVQLRGWGFQHGMRVDLGEVSGTVLPPFQR